MHNIYIYIVYIINIYIYIYIYTIYKIPGRCIAVELVMGTAKLNVINIHNYELTRGQVSGVGRYMRGCYDEDQADPRFRFSLFMGDMNFTAENEPEFKVGQAISTTSQTRPMPARVQKAQWMGILKHWVEIIQPFPTHYSHKNLKCNRIDRGWVSNPASQLLHFQVSSAVVGTPEDFEARGVSDHAPVAFSFEARAGTSQSHQTLAR